VTQNTPLIALTRAVFDDQITTLSRQYPLRSNQGDEPLAPAALHAQVAGATALIPTVADRIDAAVLDAAPGLKVVSNIGVGTNNIDIAACTARGIVVTNTPGVLTETTADMAWALLMAAARHVPQSERWLREGRWDRWALQQWLGKDVHGATLGIVGMGTIGSAVARRARGFGMKIVYTNRSRAANEAEIGAAFMPLDELLAASDFIVLVVPYSPATHHLIGAAQLAKMKRDAVLINIARGGVVDDAALVEALAAQRIGGAALDVFENEPKFDRRFLDLPNVVLTPHIGSASLATRRAMAQLAIDNCTAVLRGERAPNMVNPDVLK
jgi:lactate dehydrogenase-like 2-hydroxyacid dehydrogenase